MFLCLQHPQLVQLMFLLILDHHYYSRHSHFGHVSSLRLKYLLSTGVLGTLVLVKFLVVVG